MDKRRFCFFSLRDFSRSGGATIRMLGILNALAHRNIPVTFFSSHSSIESLDNRVQVIQIPSELRKINKRRFQFLLANQLPIPYRSHLSLYKSLLEGWQQPIIFFEHLDISIGYWLHKNGILDQYGVDIHGIAPLEFDLNVKRSISRRVMNWLKKRTSVQLDKLVLRNASLIINPSKGIKEFLINVYHLDEDKNVIVNESINSALLEQSINWELRQSIVEEYNLNEYNNIILFAGSFKELGGVSDLVMAYIAYQKEMKSDKHSVLLLVGDGELLDFCKRLTRRAEMQNNILFLGRQPYKLLKTFQSLSEIIVCPDKDTPYSQILPHIKYFDSISSGKIVINGKFEFSEELNPNECFSLNFAPSDVPELKSKIAYAIEQKEILIKKYALASIQAIKRYNYNNNVEQLVEHFNSKLKS